jgi:hypothetical protein
MQTLICQHVFEGAMPELVIIEDAELAVASCFNCADAEAVVPACPHDRIPNKELWQIDRTFPTDGVYQLLEGEYCRQPDLPETGVA